MGDEINYNSDLSHMASAHPCREYGILSSSLVALSIKLTYCYDITVHVQQFLAYALYLSKLIDIFKRAVFLAVGNNGGRLLRSDPFQYLHEGLGISGIDVYRFCSCDYTGKTYKKGKQNFSDDFHYASPFPIENIWKSP